MLWGRFPEVNLGLDQAAVAKFSTVASGQSQARLNLRRGNHASRAAPGERGCKYPQEM